MLRQFIKQDSKKIKLCGQLNHLYSSNVNKTLLQSTTTIQDNPVGAENTTEIKNYKLEPESAPSKIWKCLKRDGAAIKKNLMFWKDHKNPALDDTGRVINWDDPHAPVFPNYCDVLIIGGGAMGSSAAYWCKKIGKGSLRVVVVERDLSYKKASTVLSAGGLRQQFSLEENIKMSLFGAEFLQNATKYLGIDGDDTPIDCQFHPYGYLTLATEDRADILREVSKLQNSLGARNIILTAKQIKSKFPWINVDDIDIGCLGLEKEGWFDPWSLLYALKRKAQSLGAEYISAEAKGFSFKTNKAVTATGIPQGEYEGLEYLVVQTDDGKLRPIHFSTCVVAAGAFSGEIAKMAKIGYDKDILSVPLPVEPRKRYVYHFHAPEGPGLNTPLTIDPTGTYFRREGLANYYICGLSPTTKEDEPPIDNLDVDQDYFEHKIWPIIAKRVKAFENLKLKSSWAGYYEYNTYDNNGIIGYHPYHDNLIFSTGFSGHGIQQSPAVGRAVSELIEHKEFKTINLNKLGFDRFVTQEPMREKNIW